MIDPKNAGIPDRMGTGSGSIPRGHGETATAVEGVALSEPAEVCVSFILSTRNRADFLDRALRNAAEFLTPEDELIVIDGGSTDGTAGVVERHRGIVTLFESSPDQGEAHGLNRGILRSRGRIIKPLSDDDYFYPEAMRRSIAVLESHPEIEALMCGGEAHEVDPATGVSRLLEYRRIVHSRPPFCVREAGMTTPQGRSASVSLLAAELSEDGKLHVRLGQVHMQREEWKDAAALLQKALEKGGLEDPGNAELLLGISYYNDDRVARARTSFVRARRHDSTRKEADRWITHIENGGYAQAG